MGVVVLSALTRPMPRHRGIVLSLCGPAILVLLVGTWIVGLMCGGGLIIRPNLGTAWLPPVAPRLPTLPRRCTSPAIA